jgi:outer membrane protein OmpA-like peptidoglycan-associated protein
MKNRSFSIRRPLALLVLLSPFVLPAVALAQGDQPQFKTVKIDFVPGERTVFFDDFSDMAQDEPPPHWRLRDGAVDLKVAGDVRELYAKDTVQLTSPSIAVPPNFTFELDWTGAGETTWNFLNAENNSVLTAMVRGEEDGGTANFAVDAGCDGCGHLGDGGIQTDTSQPVHYALWVQQGRLRVYLNGQRVLDVNQVNASGITHIEASIGGYRPNGIRRIRLAESAPDFSSAISATGKYVTHGIYFDNDSDHLKPESAAVIGQVFGALDKNPNLKLEVDGYTDSVGAAPHNLDLSNRRAQAVVSVLVTQFGINAARLTARGMGQASPIASNDTAEGRASNRRVEFIRK